MHRQRWKQLGLYTIVSTIIAVALFYIYEPITLGFDIEDVLTLFVPTIVGLTVLQSIIRSSFTKGYLIGHGIVGISWALTFPLLFHWSYEKPFYFYEFANDYLFGLVLFCGLSVTHYWLLQWGKAKRIWASLYSLLDVVLLLIPAGQIGYYLSTWHCITPATMMALYQTNPEEALGFVKNIIGVGGIGGAIVGIAIILGLFYFANVKAQTNDEPTVFYSSFFQRYRNDIKWILSIALIVYGGYYLFPRTDIVSNWLEVRAYMKELQSYNDKHVSVFNNLQLSTTETAAQKTPGTVILVIGESSSRDYMKMYTPDFPYDDTPWQGSLYQNPNFNVFKHAYSSYVQTVPTLERALTERNQYDDKPFFDATTIIDVAKKAGYHTSWLSNQGVYGEYDTAISLIAKASDTPRWAHESYAFSDQYDGALLPLLKDVPKNQNNFIVIHIMGSHIYYNDRYPHEFSKWKQGPNPEGIEAYANSQLYTDWLLQEIYTYAKDNLNLQAMVYFSDHGENIKTSHNPDIFNFGMTRIPMWVYLSPTYRTAYPETANTLRNHEQQYFTNDLLYDMLVGIIHAPSGNYDATRDFSNKAYRFNVNNLTTMLGTQPLSLDPEAK